MHARYVKTAIAAFIGLTVSFFASGAEYAVLTHDNHGLETGNIILAARFRESADSEDNAERIEIYIAKDIAVSIEGEVMSMVLTDTEVYKIPFGGAHIHPESFRAARMPIELLIELNTFTLDGKRINPGELAKHLADSSRKRSGSANVKTKIEDPAAEGENSIDYPVQPGDTLMTISQVFAISVEALLRSNPHLKRNRPITPGSFISIPSEMDAIDQEANHSKQYSLEKEENRDKPLPK